MTGLVAAHAATSLRAVTIPIDAPDDLLAHLGPDGFAWFGAQESLVTAGVAATVRAADACALLVRVVHDVDTAELPPAAGPIAVGALPFDAAPAGRLIVPARVVGRDSAGRAWCTRIGRAAFPATRRRTGTARRFTVTSAIDLATWERMVRAALARIAAGELEKVVLARAVDIEADAPFDVVAVLDRLRHTQPGCTIYADGDFVGASPEMLIRVRGRDVESMPMAGTTPRGGSDADDDAAVAELATSAKEGDEHRLVVDAVLATLGDACDRIHAAGPVAARLASVTHLATRVTGRLLDARTSALDLALALHPTPAVGGTPRAGALAVLHELEAFDRERYAGPVGWVHASGAGEFVVALRGAQLDGRAARLVAGAGIVAGSDPAAEWAETQAKLEPMLRVLVRP
jgi:menaquinone-specific isochorismate synthase